MMQIDSITNLYNNNNQLHLCNRLTKLITQHLLLTYILIPKSIMIAKVEGIIMTIFFKSLYTFERSIEDD